MEEKKRRLKKSERSPRKIRQKKRREEGSLGYAKAKLSTIRVAPRKARLVADQIRGLTFEVAHRVLEFSPKSVAAPILQLLKSARANAEEVENMNVDNLYVDAIWVDAGPTMKRFMPRAMGRASKINKRTSHVTLILKEKEV